MLNLTNTAMGVLIEDAGLTEFELELLESVCEQERATLLIRLALKALGLDPETDNWSIRASGDNYMYVSRDFKEQRTVVDSKVSTRNTRRIDLLEEPLYPEDFDHLNRCVHGNLRGYCLHSDCDHSIVTLLKDMEYAARP